MHDFLNNDVNKSCKDCISWGAIFAGIVAALGVASLLNLLGLGLGLANFSFDSTSIKSLSFATIIWLVLNGVISMFVGGWVAGLLAGKLENRAEYLLHGFLMWSLTMMITFWVATTSVGFAVSGLLGATQKALTAAGKGVIEVGSAMAPQVKNVVSAVMPNNQLLTSINQQANEIFEKAQQSMRKNLSLSEVESAGANSLSQEALASTNEEFLQAIEALFSAQNKNDVEKAKQAVANLLIEKGELSEHRANELVAKWYDRYKRLKEKATSKTHHAKQTISEVAEKATSVLSKLSLLSLVTLLLGAVSACAGAWMGSFRRE